MHKGLEEMFPHLFPFSRVYPITHVQPITATAARALVLLDQTRSGDTDADCIYSSSPAKTGTELG